MRFALIASVAKLAVDALERGDTAYARTLMQAIEEAARAATVPPTGPNIALFEQYRNYRKAMEH